MNKTLLTIAAFTFLSFSAIAQTKSSDNASDSIEVTGSEYIPVEGHSATGVPAELQGLWVLQSGIKAKTPKEDVFSQKKPTPGTELRRDTIKSTNTVNGVAYTSTEVQIERVATPEKQITPAQKEKMHHPEKPSISFYGQNETFSGFTGCNKYSGRYSINGNKISLNNAAASTKMVCIGNYDEKAFLNTLSQVNSFRSNNGQLELLRGNDVLLVFSKK